MQGWLLYIIKTTFLEQLELPVHPVGHFLVLGYRRRGSLVRRCVLGWLWFRVPVRLSGRAHERSEPWVAKKHIIGRSALGVLIKTGPHEGVRVIRVALVWERGWVAMDDCLWL